MTTASPTPIAALDAAAAPAEAGDGARPPLTSHRLLPLALGLFVAVLYAWSGVHWHDSRAAWVLGSLLAGLAAAGAARLAAEIAALRQLEHGIHNAREGLMLPTADRGLGWTVAGRLIPEHNQTVAALALMFRTVEDCQVRFLHERNRVTTILQSLPSALLGITDELEVSIANRQAEALFGAEPGALAGRNLFDLLVPDDHGRALLRDAFLYKQEIRQQELRLQLDGGARHFGISLAFYSDEQDDIAGVMILQDVTEHRMLMETVAMREKLVAMGQLAAGVAHELNTPLGNILGYAQLMRGATAAPEERNRYADIVVDEARRCSRVVQDLLAYARKDSCSGETCDVNQTVRELLEAFVHCRLQRYGIEVDLELAPEPQLAEGGCGELDIALTNVMANAIQALAATPQPRIAIRTWTEPAHVAIAVSDNGPGVPHQARSRLFDPFFTTKDVGQGSGLGLFISQAVVTRRGGRIDFDASHGGGACFVIRLPRVDVARVRAS